MLEPSESLQESLQVIGEKMSQEWQAEAGEQGKKILDDFLESTK